MPSCRHKAAADTLPVDQRWVSVGSAPADRRHPPATCDGGAGTTIEMPLRTIEASAGIPDDASMIQNQTIRLGRLVAAVTGLAVVATACIPVDASSTADTPATTIPIAVETTVPPTTVPSNDEIDTFVRDITDWDAIAPAPAPLGRARLGEPTEPTEAVIDVERTDDAGAPIVEREAYVCQSQDYSLTENPREVVLADPSAGQLWPGALLDGAAHAQGALRPIAINRDNRAPLGISVAGGGVLGIRSGISTIVDEPTGSTVREGINQLIANALEADVVTGAGYSSFESVESHSSNQVALELGLSARYLGHRLDAELDYSKNVNESTYTAYFIQRLYTIAVDAPQTPSDFFAAAVTPDELAAAGIGPDTPPLYVGSVSYGRILMYSITSTDSAEQIAGAIEYSYNGLAGGVSAEVAASYEETLSNSAIQVLAVGGPTPACRTSSSPATSPATSSRTSPSTRSSPSPSPSTASRTTSSPRSSTPPSTRRPPANSSVHRCPRRTTGGPSTARSTPKPVSHRSVV